MLRWFAYRLARKGKDVKKDERGFTLIELLVVVIIIGILAAIAIPTFLGQRDSARESAVQSDLRNAAAAAQSCAADNGGSYESCTGQTLIDDYDWNRTKDVTTNVSAGSADTWSATANHADDDTTFEFNTDTGRVEEQQS